MFLAQSLVYKLFQSITEALITITYFIYVEMSINAEVRNANILLRLCIDSNHKIE